MTVKKRLALSNILMILVPVCITVLTACVCLVVIRLSLEHGTHVDLTDPDDFPEVSRRITSVIEHILEKSPQARKAAFLQLDETLKPGSISYSVTGTAFAVSGGGPLPAGASRLMRASSILDDEGYISDGTLNLYSCHIDAAGGPYLLRLYGYEGSIPYTMLVRIIVFSAIVLSCVVFISVFLTNRFLIRFVFRRIEQPLDILADGVHQIHDGNLEYRIRYPENDEFTPVCADFNEMAVRLKASVDEVKQHEDNRKELFAGISHDLRSPLASIRAYVEGLLDGVASTPDMQKSYLQTIKVKAEELAHMISELFLFSKMDMDEFPVHLQYLDLAEEVSIWGTAFKKDHPSGSFELQTDLEKVTIRADRELLRRIFDNIVGNSLKYTVHHVCVVQISVKKKQTGIILSFSDNGPGVPESQLPRLFDVFFRCDSSRRNPGKGSGLGLAITSKAVERMGGAVTAQNISSGGLSIIMTFPEPEA